ncbi:MAG: hypothetical protein IK062_11615 [Selenomonadaceae bacterium]|nr:hypothetical protein [Selenomonadaceae bacterium]
MFADELAEGKKEAAAESEKKSKLEAIKKMMLKLRLSAREAMDVLDIPSDKQKEYQALI